MITRVVPEVRGTTEPTLLNTRMRIPDRFGNAAALSYRWKNLQWVLATAIHDELQVPNLVHVLHAESEADLTLRAGDRQHPIAPGDSMVATGRVSLSQPGILIALPWSQLQPAIPTHGVERFDGFNRCSTYGAPDFERWKLTTPLSCATRDCIAMMVIYGRVSVLAPDVVETLQPGDALAISSQTVTVVPDGLAYVLVFR